MSPHAQDADLRCLAGITINSIQPATNHLPYFKKVRVEQVLDAPGQELDNQAFRLISDNLKLGYRDLEIEIGPDQIVEPNTTILLQLYKVSDGTTFWKVYRDSHPTRFH